MSRAGVVVAVALVACRGARDAPDARPAAPPAAPAMRYAALPPPPPLDPARLDKARALAPELDKLFADDLAANKYPGLGVAIVLDGEPVYVKGFGLRDLATKAPFDADTLFPIASVTKSFAAMAILKLRDEGRLSLDAPAATYYPPLAELAYPTRDSPPVTVRELLGHGSGLPEDNYWVDVQIDMSEADLLALIRSGMSFSRAPDTYFEYSNVGYGIAGQIIAKVSGMPAREYIRKEILAPLGMTASVWSRREAPPDRFAVGYWGADGYQGIDTQKLPSPVKEPAALDVAGGLYTTLGDLARYVAYHLSAWPPRDDAESGPVRRSTLREMHQGTRRADWVEFALEEREPVPFVEVSDDRVRLTTYSYGNGFMSRFTCSDDLQVEHSGGLPGYGTYLTMLPERGVGVVLFVNDTRIDSRPDRAALELLRKAGLLEKRAVTPAPALLAAQKTVDRLLATWNADEAIQLFEPTWFRYQPVEGFGAQLQKLAADHGRCQPASPLEAPNRLRGGWRVTCERGAIRFAAALSPNASPRLQYLKWASELPASPAMKAAATALLRDRDARARLALDGGTCTLGDAVDGDGTKHSVFALTCTKRPLELEVSLDDANKVASWRVHRARTDDTRYCAR